MTISSFLDLKSGQKTKFVLRFTNPLNVNVTVKISSPLMNFDSENTEDFDKNYGHKVNFYVN